MLRIWEIEEFMEKNTVDMTTLHCVYESHNRISLSSDKQEPTSIKYRVEQLTQKKDVDDEMREKKRMDKILNRIPHIFIGIGSERCMWWYENKTTSIKTNQHCHCWNTQDFPQNALRKDISFSAPHFSIFFSTNCCFFARCCRCRRRFFCSLALFCSPNSVCADCDCMALIPLFNLVYLSSLSFHINSHGVQWPCSHLMFRLLAIPNALARCLGGHFSFAWTIVQRW